MRRGNLMSYQIATAPKGRLAMTQDRRARFPKRAAWIVQRTIPTMSTSVTYVDFEAKPNKIYIVSLLLCSFKTTIVFNKKTS